MKITKNTYRKIDLSLIDKTENVRQDMGDIAELADSIKNLGQLEAIGVVEKQDGRFDMLYGFRRLAAFQFLVDAGQDYNQIEAKIITGDPLIIQMAENEARKSLTAEEFENGIARMVEAGMKPAEISKLLSIRITRISDTLAARKTRLKLAKKGIDTTGLSTSTVSALRNEAPDIVEKVKKAGGTVKAVKKVKEEKKKKDNPSMFVANEPEVIEEKQEPVNIEKRLDQLPTGVGKQPIIENIKIKQAPGVLGLKESIIHIECAFIPVILESPYQSDDSDTLSRNKKYLLDCLEDCIKRNESPYASHKIFPDFLDENEKREIGIAAGQAWYAHAAYMVIYDDYGITPGMQAGIDYFKSIKPDAKIEIRKLNGNDKP